MRSARAPSRPACWAASALAALLLGGCGGHLLPELHSDADRLSVARRLYDRADYVDAIELLKTYVSSSGGAADVDEAIYLLGACYLRTKEWGMAAIEFERLLRDYPESDSGGAAAFGLGQAYYGQSRKPDFDQEYTVRALEQWQAYRRAYPGHWLDPEADRLVLEARTRLARKLLSTGKLYLRLKLPEPARVYFRRVMDEYSDTVVVPEAELGLALADARDGRRAQALERLREIETRYAGRPVAEQAARERRRLDRKS